MHIGSVSAERNHKIHILCTKFPHIAELYSAQRLREFPPWNFSSLNPSSFLRGSLESEVALLSSCIDDPSVENIPRLRMALQCRSQHCKQLQTPLLIWRLAEFVVSADLANPLKVRVFYDIWILSVLWSSNLRHLSWQARFFSANWCLRRGDWSDIINKINW